MRVSSRFLLSVLPLATVAVAQSPDFLITTTLPEQTLSGSGGTSLQFLQPNEIALMQACPLSTEKWAPRTCFHTMAGDDDGDAIWWKPAVFGQIDALLCMPSASGTVGDTQRTAFWSPSQALGTVVSGTPGLRPGDVGRIIQNSSFLDGQVEYFITAEQVQTALGLPITPILVNVDGIAADPTYGVLFSLESDINANLCTGTTLVRDGDVVLIPWYQITWAPNLTVQSVVSNSAVVAYTEAQMDSFVAASGVADRFGNCVTQVVDTSDFEIDWPAGPSTVQIQCGGAVAWVPNLVFAAETLTGGSLLTTAGGGMIYSSGCNTYGSACIAGPTLGNQIGLLPPNAALGIPSSVNGLASTQAHLFVSESSTPMLNVGSSAVIDFDSPAPTTWVMYTLAPTTAGAVAFSWNLGLSLYFPDFYPWPTILGTISTVGGFGTYVSPPIPLPCKVVVQGLTFATSGSIDLSTPTTIEVF